MRMVEPLLPVAVRREAHDLGEVAVHVRLIAVTTIETDLGEGALGCAAEGRETGLHTRDASVALRAHPDRFDEDGTEASRTEAGIGRDRFHLSIAARQLRESPRNLGTRRVGQKQSRREPDFELIELSIRVRHFREPPEGVGDNIDTPEVGECHVTPGDRRDIHSENWQRTGAELRADGDTLAANRAQVRKRAGPADDRVTDDASYAVRGAIKDT